MGEYNIYKRTIKAKKKILCNGKSDVVKEPLYCLYTNKTEMVIILRRLYLSDTKYCKLYFRNYVKNYDWFMFFVSIRYKHTSIDKN